MKTGRDSNNLMEAVWGRVVSLLGIRMSPSGCQTVQKWSTVAGCLLLMLPIGLPWYWGNMSMYAVSYVAVRGQSLRGIHTPWIISFYFMCNAVGLFIAGTVSRHVETKQQRLVLLSGIILFLAGFFLTYFSVSKSVVWMNVTLGVMAGLGGGIIHGMALQYAVGWTGSDLGFVNSLVQSGYNAGSIFINPFITFYLNPQNISTDLNFGASKIFSHADILDSVPRFFVMLGSLCLGVFAIGFAMIRDPEPGKGYDRLVVEGDDDKNDERTELLEPPSPGSGYSGYTFRHANDIRLPDVVDACTSSDNGDDEINDEINDNDPKSIHFAGAIAASSGATKVGDVHPRDMIKSRPFLTLCISLMMYDNAMLVLANYYKEFGSTYINDDYFLACLGTVLTSTTVLAFPFWGLLADRVGVKKTLIAMYSIASILCFSMFFTPRISKLSYTVNIASLGSFLTPIYSILIIATCKIYGKAYYSSNVGVVGSLSLLCNFVNPLIFEKILNIGWFYIFCYGGSLTGTALICIILTLPDM